MGFLFILLFKKKNFFYTSCHICRHKNERPCEPLPRKCSACLRSVIMMWISTLWKCERCGEDKEREGRPARWKCSSSYLQTPLCRISDALKLMMHKSCRTFGLFPAIHICTWGGGEKKKSHTGHIITVTAFLEPHRTHLFFLIKIQVSVV